MADLRRMIAMRRGGRYGFTRPCGSHNDRRTRWIGNSCTKEEPMERSCRLPPTVGWALPRRWQYPLLKRVSERSKGPAAKGGGLPAAIEKCLRDCATTWERPGHIILPERSCKCE